MESPKRKIQCLTNPDRISDLPSEIKENILVRIPIEQAVRTCVLSTKWKSAWKSIPDLSFTNSIVRTSNPNPTNRLSKFIRFIDMFLLLHNGPIRKFSLFTSFPFHDAIERWILILSKNKIEEICIELNALSFPFMIPYLFCSCCLLRKIQLANCISEFLPLSFEGFKLLHSLKLKDCIMGDDYLNHLIAKSPNLEDLDLDLDLMEFGENLIINAQNLKILKIEGRWKKELEILGHFIKYFSEISFVNLKVLKLEMDLSDHKLDYFALSLFQNTPMLEKLYIKNMVEQDMGQVNGTFWKSAPKENIFTNLKHFEICHDHESNSLCAFAKVVLSTASLLETFYIVNPERAPPVKKLLWIKRASNKVEVYVPRKV
ncbi:hypothetical protein LUZ60_003973 [Juncus effusus]|nr:hypothetical protein LUZ60_003973 [Juncus effusus]